MSSLRWDEDKYQRWLVERSKTNQVERTQPDAGDESRLLKRCLDFCREQGYYVFHDYSRGVNQPGHPDLIIGMPGGRTVWIELKSRRGRMSEEQKMIYMKLKAMGHDVHRDVKSYKQFIEIMHN